MSFLVRIWWVPAAPLEPLNLPALVSLAPVWRLEDVIERLDRAGSRYLRGHPAVGKDLYVNDPDGQPRLGTNVEIIEYQPGASRSGSQRQTNQRATALIQPGFPTR